MRTLAIACLVALTAIACSNGDDDEGGSAGPVRLDFAGIEPGTFGSCDVVGVITNFDDDRFCDVFVSHLAFDDDDFVIGDSFVDIPDVAPGESVEFEAPLFGSGGEIVFCDEIDRIELDELEAFCG